jgi:polysaccharide pyruvyl transferase WcaK-like protein
VSLRVGVYGLLGSGNIGNDGSFDAMLDYLGKRHGDALVDVITDSPEGVAARWGLSATRLHWNRGEYTTATTPGAVLRKGLGKLMDAVRIAAWVRRHDVVVTAGMGAFEATQPLRPWGTPYSQFLICTFGRLFGTRTGWVSVGAGGATRPALRALFRGAARRAHYLSYRDALSREEMRRMGLAERGDRVFPDLAYALPAPEASPQPTGVVGVGVLDYYGGNDDRDRADELHRAYVEKVQLLVRMLLDDGRRVRLLTGDRVDERVVEQVLDDVRHHRPDAFSRVEAEPVPTLQDLMRQMAGVDVVVASRFHNVLCALKMARPTVSIGYAAKNDALMAEMGLAGYCHRADSFDPAEVHRQLVELDGRREQLVPAMTACVGDLRSRLEEQFDLLDEALFPVRPATSGVRDPSRPTKNP